MMSSTPMIQRLYNVGDVVWVLIRCHLVNPGFRLVSAPVEEVVSFIESGQIAYRLRLPDQTLAVVMERDCHKSRQSLLDGIEESIGKNIVISKRLSDAIKESDEESKAKTETTCQSGDPSG